MCVKNIINERLRDFLNYNFQYYLFFNNSIKLDLIETNHTNS